MAERRVKRAKGVKSTQGHGSDNGERSEDVEGVGNSDSTEQNKNVLRNGQETKGETNEEEAKAEASEILTRKPQPTVAQFLVAAFSDPSSEAAALGDEYIWDAVRKNDYRPALLTFVIPDEAAMNLNGMPELRDVYMLVRIPREFYEKTIRT